LRDKKKSGDEKIMNEKALSGLRRILDRISFQHCSISLAWFAGKLNDRKEQNNKVVWQITKYKYK
jgi:hypothetical protein